MGESRWAGRVAHICLFRLELSAPCLASETWIYDGATDALGRHLRPERQRDGDGGKTFAYDSENRLTSMSSGSVTLAYDGDGNRVSKTAGASPQSTS